MKFTFTEKRMDSSEDLRAYAMKKIGKLDKLFKGEADAYVTFSLDTHSRQEALEWIRTSDHRHYLAIYDPKTRVTVTGGYAMEQKD